MQRRRLSWSWVMTSALLVCAACGGGDAAPSPISNVGQWSGTTAHGMPIAFTVSAGERVTAISFGYRFNSCTGSKTYTDLSLETVPQVICVPGPCDDRLASFRRFHYSEGSPLEGPSTTISGLFIVHGVSAEGSINFHDYPECGTVLGVGWAAQKRQG